MESFTIISYLSYLKSQGVKMVFATDLVTNVFHEFAEYLYGKNMQVRDVLFLSIIFHQKCLKLRSSRTGSPASIIWRV